MTELTCRDVVDFLEDYLDHELDPGQRDIFEAHLAHCDHCVAYIRSYQQTIRLGRQAFDRLDQPADEQLPEELVAAILAARRRAR